MSARRLDANQRAVVEARDPALLVLAGAGAGKTHTLIERALGRIHDPHAPVEGNRVGMLTFSRKACGEIAERLDSRVSGGQTAPRVLTYHAFGYELVRQQPALCQRSGGRPTLMDDGDQRRMFNTCAREAGLGGSELKLARGAYDFMRNHGLDARDANHAKTIRERFIPDDVDPDTFVTLAGDYEDFKAASNVLDFNDLQVLPAHALRDQPEYRAEVANQFDELIIDEAQDTNLVQYRLLYLLASAPHMSVVMVGDDDQSIYGWRGAAPENLKRFERDFRPARHFLGANYRSTPQVVDTAERMVAHNPSRDTEKTTYSADPHYTGPAPALRQHNASSDACEAVAEHLERAIRRGHSPSGQAVLYRVNRLGTQLEASLLRRGIPYQIQKGLELTKRQEVQMAFAAVRLAINDQDASAFARLSGLVSGFGDKSVERVIDMQHENGGRLIDLARTHCSERARLDWNVVDSAVDIIRRTPPDEMGICEDWAMGITAYTDWLKGLCARAEDPEAAYEERLENLRYFESAIAGYTRQARRNGEAIDHPLDAWQGVLELSLTGPSDTMDDADIDAVTLGTVHKAKGLEWNSVQILGFSETLMPAGSEVLDDEDADGTGMEEERRLAYVAMTRARYELVLHHAETLDLPGQRRQTPLSRFAVEAGLAPNQKVTMNTARDNRQSGGENPLFAKAYAQKTSGGPSFG